MFDTTVVMNTMTDVTDQKNNIQGLLLNFHRNVESSYSIPCQVLLARNNVVERRNKTFKNMVKNMFSHFTLLESF